MLRCAEISAAFAEYAECSETHSGVRIKTQCLYPSFERVEVFVVGFGSGAVIHDGGGALRNAWLHGREDRNVAGRFARVASKFGCEFTEKQFRITIEDTDWLYSAVLTVANASADAARSAIEKVRSASEQSIISKAKAVFDTAPYKPQTQLDYSFKGESGKRHLFDLAVLHNKKIALIDAVVSHPSSVAAKYLAFSDTPRHSGIFKYAIFDGILSSPDRTLISDVADLIEIDTIVNTDGKELLEIAA